jgi:hypothetical protein
MANHKLSMMPLKTPVSFRWTVPLKGHFYENDYETKVRELMF